jgi:hypothetical protein
VNADQLAGILEAIRDGTPALPGARCKGRTEWDHTDDPELTEYAINQCFQCPALQRCSDWSSTLTHRQLPGVVAGEVREWIQHPSRRRKTA